MPTTNPNITPAWTQIADIGDASLLVTWDFPTPIEVATTAANAAPTVNGHKLVSGDAITRSVIGPGYVWARIGAGAAGAANLPLVVSK